jgi:hypothetical protein
MSWKSILKSEKLAILVQMGIPLREARKLKTPRNLTIMAKHNPLSIGQWDILKILVQEEHYQKAVDIFVAFLRKKANKPPEWNLIKRFR